MSLRISLQKSNKGTASSVTFLTLCIFLPTIFFRFIAGTVADRQNKKLVMLIADLVAASGTLIIFILYGSGIALIFFISGLAGMIISLIRLTKPIYKELDQ